MTGDVSRKAGVPRMTGSRRRILAAIEEAGGRITSREGRAVDVLAQALGEDVSILALRQALPSMELAGLIRRDVRGRRTYELSLPLEELQRRAAAAAPDGDGTAEALDREDATDAGTDGDPTGGRSAPEVNGGAPVAEGGGTVAGQPAPAVATQPLAVAPTVAAIGTGGRAAVFVDSTWLVAQAGSALHGTPDVSRLDVDAAGLADLARETAAEELGDQVLRTYWYAAGEGPGRSTPNPTLARQPGVALRLGRGDGDRAGIDALVVRDLVLLAARGAISTAVVASASADLSDALATIRDLGVRVVLLTAPGPAATEALAPIAEHADHISRLDRDRLAELVRAGSGTAAGATSRAGVPATPWSAPSAGTSAGSAGAPVGQWPAPPTSGGPAHLAAPVAGGDDDWDDEDDDLDDEPWNAIESAGRAGAERAAQRSGGGATPDAVDSAGASFGVRWALSANEADRQVVWAKRPMLPGWLDAQLLRAAEEATGGSLRNQHELRRQLRAAFWRGATSVGA